MVFFLSCTSFCSPILRSPEEHETVYKTLKIIPDINDQLSDEELRELVTCVVREYWVKGSTGKEDILEWYKILVL